MEYEEIVEKLSRLQNNESNEEVFQKTDPLQEGNNTVKVKRHDDNNFYLLVRDQGPDTECYTKEIAGIQHTANYITSILNEKQNKRTEHQTEYINIYWEEWG